MEKVFTPKITTCQPPLRAMVEMIDGALKIYPIAETDEHAAKILESLRFFTEASGEQ